MSMLDMLGIGDGPKEEGKKIVAEQKKSKVLKGRMRKRPGLKLWCLNNGVLREIKEDDYEEVTAVIDGNGAGVVRKKIIDKPGDIFFQALNRKNALRKAKKHGFISQNAE